ncbi:HAD hydrolase family protein [Gracilimonas amylolytica]|uniref:HAD hydrolase family protein n=1 Tax=Gracilimonas amylolytica TaxID=1749045 RepID=UPI000CD96B91|nr:HAD hydrolase family protein [Gracilimonas amylolytica]
MIKLFITDLDGCMAHPFISPNWKAVTRIRELIAESKEDDTIPAMTICSGRPFPYVEAVGQWLGVEAPMLFESGAGIYDIKVNKITWNPHFNDEAKQAVEEIKEWLVSTLIPNYDGTYPEFAKYTDAGLVNPDPSKIAMMHQEVLNHMDGKYPMFEVHATDVSVNIILKKANKGHGIKMLCDQLGLNLDEVAYIGDSSGDLPGLTIVGRSYAPVNAKSFVKDKVDVVTKETTEGVLEAYEDIIKRNRTEG